TGRLLIMNTDILIERNGPVWTLVFNRPEKRNALTHAMYEALVEGLAAADADPDVRAVILTGSGNCFTAGNDLQDFLRNPPTGHDSPVIRFLQTLMSFPKPLLAAVPGVAVGIGTTLLLHCDLAWAAPQARFELPFARLALVPEGAASYLLPLAIGAKQANAMLLAGEPVDAPTAVRLGLINDVIEADMLPAHVQAWAERLASLPSQALLHTKALLRAPHRPAMEAALSQEVHAFTRQLQSAEARAAMQAFFNRK
ncbi:MAG TPA: enoyl-CoA hydratase, partial [Candidatus Macondimonas sp.]|nr:enoyl-CoA hydratase [Candidatus Macondimonas sp.]